MCDWFLPEGRVSERLEIGDDLFRVGVNVEYASDALAVWWDPKPLPNLTRPTAGTISPLIYWSSQVTQTLVYLLRITTKRTRSRLTLRL